MANGIYLKPCFGYSATKGGKVGERHRWSGDIRGPGWGRGRCIWCHRDLEQLKVKEQPTPAVGSDEHLAKALATGA
jgi:hypothetical protein